MDFNAHMGNSRILDRCGDTRMMFFNAHGYPAQEFRRRSIGPVVMSDSIRYYAELHLGRTIRVTLELDGMADDGSRFRLRNQVYEGEKLAATVISTVGWLDLDERRLAPPPEDLVAVLRTLDQTEDFDVLPSSRSRNK